MEQRNVLFICTGNVYRSRRAAEIVGALRGYAVRSAGTAPVWDGVPVTQTLIDWADEIYVMSEREDRHESFLRSHFKIGGKEIRVLGIPNVYEGSPEEQNALRSVLSEKLSPYFPDLLGV